MVGADPPNHWGDYNWNAFDWGSGGPVDDIIVGVGKLLTNSQSIATATNHKVITHLMEGDSFVLTTALILEVEKLLSNTLSPTEDLSNQTLRSGDWCRILPSDACNLEDRDFTSWTAGSGPSDGWTKTTNPSDSWS